MTKTKLGISAALVAAAFGAQAQTVETHYPLVVDNANVSAPTESAAQGRPSAAPFLVQSNNEGVKVNPAHAKASTLTRDEVRAQAEIIVPPSTGHNG